MSNIISPLLIFNVRFVIKLRNSGVIQFFSFIKSVRRSQSRGGSGYVKSGTFGGFNVPKLIKISYWRTAYIISSFLKAAVRNSWSGEIPVVGTNFSNLYFTSHLYSVITKKNAKILILKNKQQLVHKLYCLISSQNCSLSENSRYFSRRYRSTPSILARRTRWWRRPCRRTKSSTSAARTSEPSSCTTWRPSRAVPEAVARSSSSRSTTSPHSPYPSSSSSTPKVQQHYSIFIISYLYIILESTGS